jgi:hypothetical protein
MKTSPCPILVHVRRFHSDIGGSQKRAPSLCAMTTDGSIEFVKASRKSYAHSTDCHAFPSRTAHTRRPTYSNCIHTGMLALRTLARSAPRSAARLSTTAARTQSSLVRQTSAFQPAWSASVPRLTASFHNSVAKRQESSGGTSVWNACADTG